MPVNIPPPGADDLAAEGVRFQATGAGRITLLFVHGFACAGDDWDRQVEELATDFCCMTIDLPGHGASAPPNATTLAALAAAVNNVRRVAGANPVVLIGHSMGAKIVREAFRQQPDGVLGIILMEGSLYVGAREDLVARAREMVDRNGFPAFAQNLFAEMFIGTTDPAIRDGLLARAGGFDPAFGRELFLETVGWDPLHGEDTLRRIDVPLLLLQSTYFDADFIRRPIEPGGSASFIDLVRQFVPHAQTIVVPDCGHFPMLDAPATVNRHIHDFASRISADFGDAKRAGGS